MSDKPKFRPFDYVITFDKAHVPDLGDVSNEPLSFSGEPLRKTLRNERLHAVIQAYPGDESVVNFKVDEHGTCVLLGHDGTPHSMEDVCPDGDFAWSDKFPYYEILTPFKAGRFLLPHMHIPPWTDWYYDAHNLGPAIRRYQKACAAINNKRII